MKSLNYSTLSLFQRRVHAFFPNFGGENISRGSLWYPMGIKACIYSIIHDFTAFVQLSGKNSLCFYRCRLCIPFPVIKEDGDGCAADQKVPQQAQQIGNLVKEHKA